ncbi:winged helix-turn-helix transcriptional regulator [Fictibacillus aquaticus]|uniref:MarR family transcriptional regulator n=1 Tax=Fictibacillus aquaticus TaxID=2021314 RepID=A0A235F9B7_9BACL|nr:winged helix-turn-helix transcriptional regulator [Fictibacillus aquaticus]OYD57613.1 MarR family transcriptional regulator [Fictibacillus aquaticus]
MKTYYCNMEIFLEVTGGKWKGLILYYLLQGPKRTGELKKLVHNISQKMLIQTLRELESDGLVHRKMYNQVPPKVEYSTTELGQSLEPLFKTLCKWGEDYAEKKFSKDEYQILNKD